MVVLVVGRGGEGLREGVEEGVRIKVVILLYIYFCGCCSLSLGLLFFRLFY